LTGDQSAAILGIFSRSIDRGSTDLRAWLKTSLGEF
jgi:hypothetical protein